MTKYCETFCIEEHKHRFAAWAAARAAATKGVRFTVAQGKQVLEAIGLPREPEQLPLPFEMEAAHRVWRKEAIAAAGGRPYLPWLSH